MKKEHTTSVNVTSDVISAMDALDDGKIVYITYKKDFGLKPLSDHIDCISQDKEIQRTHKYTVENIHVAAHVHNDVAATIVCTKEAGHLYLDDGVFEIHNV